MATYQDDLRSTMRQAGAIDLDTDDDAACAAEALFEAQQVLSRMRGDKAFARAVQTKLADQRKAAAAAEREAGGKSQTEDDDA
jgi:hypothetical protein